MSPQQVELICAQMRDGKLFEEIAEGSFGLITPSVCLEAVRSLTPQECASLMDDWQMVVSSRVASAAMKNPDAAAPLKLALESIRGLTKKMGDQMADKKASNSGRSISIRKVSTGYIPTALAAAARPKVDYAAMAQRAAASLVGEKVNDGAPPDQESVYAPPVEPDAAPSAPMEYDEPDIPTTPSAGFSAILQGDLVVFDERLPAGFRGKGIRTTTAVLVHMGCDAQFDDLDALIALDPRLHDPNILAVRDIPGDAISQADYNAHVRSLRTREEQARLDNEAAERRARAKLAKLPPILHGAERLFDDNGNPLVRTVNTRALIAKAFKD